MENSQNESKTVLGRIVDGFNKGLPIAFLVWGIALSVGGYFLYIRDTATVQAQSIRDVQREVDGVKKTMDERKSERDKQIFEMRSIIVTKDIFDERTKAIQDEQLRQRQMLERILEK